MKNNNIPATTAPASPALSVAPGSTLWSDKSKTPSSKGWYITRRDDGEMSWRAWGNDAWWKQIKGGWIEWFDADGAAMRFDWMPHTRKSIDSDSDQLPDIADYLFEKLEASIRKANVRKMNTAYQPPEGEARRLAGDAG